MKALPIFIAAAFTASALNAQFTTDVSWTESDNINGTAVNENSKVSISGNSTENGGAIPTITFDLGAGNEATISLLELGYRNPSNEPAGSLNMVSGILNIQGMRVSIPRSDGVQGETVSDERASVVTVNSGALLNFQDDKAASANNSATSLLLGYASNQGAGNGKLVVDGGTVTFANTKYNYLVSLGESVNSKGVLEIKNGGSFTDSGTSAVGVDLVVARGAGSNGTVTVAGAGSSLNLTNAASKVSLANGANSTALIEVTGGGQLVLGTASTAAVAVSIGSGAGSNGKISVSGAGSKAAYSQSSSTSFYISNAAGATGTLEFLDGARGEFKVKNFRIGQNGTGTLSLDNSTLALYEQNPDIGVGVTNDAVGRISITNGAVLGGINSADPSGAMGSLNMVLFIGGEWNTRNSSGVGSILVDGVGSQWNGRDGETYIGWANRAAAVDSGYSASVTVSNSAYFKGGNVWLGTGANTTSLVDVNTGGTFRAFNLYLSTADNGNIKGVNSKSYVNVSGVGTQLIVRDKATVGTSNAAYITGNEAVFTIGGGAKLVSENAGAKVAFTINSSGSLVFRLGEADIASGAIMDLGSIKINGDGFIGIDLSAFGSASGLESGDSIAVTLLTTTSEWTDFDSSYVKLISHNGSWESIDIADDVAYIWNGSTGSLILSMTYVPEPGACAALAGALALGIAAYSRKRR